MLTAATVGSLLPLSGCSLFSSDTSYNAPLSEIIIINKDTKDHTVHFEVLREGDQIYHATKTVDGLDGKNSYRGITIEEKWKLKEGTYTVVASLKSSNTDSEIELGRFSDRLKHAEEFCHGVEITVTSAENLGLKGRLENCEPVTKQE